MCLRSRRSRALLTVLLTLALGGGVLGTADARKPSRERRAEKLRETVRRELELTDAANALARAHAALERERESLAWAGELLARRGDESMRKLDAYRDHRIERERLGTVRARKLYKLARGGGMLEAMFEEGEEGRLSPVERINRGRALRRLIDHDLEQLATHAEAEARARAELLTSTRELSALSALESISRIQARAVEHIGASVDPQLIAAHGKRRRAQARVRSRSKAERTLLRNLTRARRDLRRHRGLDLLEDDALVRPVEGRVIGEFGPYVDPLLKVPMSRKGVELAARSNDTVRALAPGEVVMVGALPGFERVVVLDHGGGYLSLTGRMLTVLVEEGQEVDAGAALGRVGPKAVPDGLGTSVYIEVRHGQRPVDPAPYLRSRRRRR